jgi:glycine hydroxymethyltransferase
MNHINNDPDVYDAIQRELERQQEGLELIPSENIVSPAVLQANASIFTNKYSEGYPGKRYYGGNEIVDDIETLAIERAKQLFNADHVNVQPYSGSPANQAVYMTLMEPGDTFLGLKLSHGGHLTHGHKINFSGQLYNAVHYTVDKQTERIDMDHVRDLAEKHEPTLIEAGYTAYPRKVNWEAFRKICDDVGAKLFVDMSHIGGLVAGNAHPSPIPHADVVTTTTHKTLRGPRGAIILCKEQYADAIDKTVFPGLQGGPHEHTIAAKAVAFKEALNPSFTDYAQQIVTNAQALATTLRDEGFRLVSDGTDTHLILVDLTDDDVNGAEAEAALEQAGIYVNKNTIPFDPNPPFNPSGIRLGTPVLTTRGMKTEEMQTVGKLIATAINNHDNDDVLNDVNDKVLQLCSAYPIYENLDPLV